jgi:uncharacterized protein YjbJ (UPF0337 family)
MAKAMGKAKEMTGKVSGDRAMEAEGRLDRARGEVKKEQARSREGVRETGRAPKRGRA